MENTKLKTQKSEQEKKTIVNRLNRIAGQIAGVKRMILENKYCKDILNQLSAACKSIKSLANFIIEKYMFGLLKNNKNGDVAALSEVSSLFKQFQ